MVGFQEELEVTTLFFWVSGNETVPSFRAPLRNHPKILVNGLKKSWWMDGENRYIRVCLPNLNIQPSCAEKRLIYSSKAGKAWHSLPKWRGWSIGFWNPSEKRGPRDFQIEGYPRSLVKLGNWSIEENVLVKQCYHQSVVTVSIF